MTARIRQKNLKETNLVLVVCKKEYQGLYLEHEKLQLRRIKRLNLAILSLMKKNWEIPWLHKESQKRDAIRMLILMMAFNLVTNLAVMKKFSKRRKRLNQGREL